MELFTPVVLTLTDFLIQSSWYIQEVIGPNREERPLILGLVPGKVSVTGLSVFLFRFLVFENLTLPGSR